MVLIFLPVTTPTNGLLNTAISGSKLLSLFLTTLYQQDIESGQEHVIFLVVAGVVTGSGVVVGKGMSILVFKEKGLVLF
jgi:hypothetical protein